MSSTNLYSDLKKIDLCACSDGEQKSLMKSITLNMADISAVVSNDRIPHSNLRVAADTC